MNMKLVILEIIGCLYIKMCIYTCIYVYMCVWTLYPNIQLISAFSEVDGVYALYKDSNSCFFLTTNTFIRPGVDKPFLTYEADVRSDN